MGIEKWRVQVRDHGTGNAVYEQLFDDELTARAEYEARPVPPWHRIELWHRPAFASRFKRIDERVNAATPGATDAAVKGGTR